jgi:hypothetical protein
VSVDRWVHCQFCQQTYAAARGDRCSLCRKAGGIVDVPRPQMAPASRDRVSWTPAAGPDDGISLAAGCLGILVGTMLGVVIALGLPSGKTRQPAAAGNLAENPARPCGLSVLPILASRVVLGGAVGALGGALASVLLLLVLLAHLSNRPSGDLANPQKMRHSG